jgi:hypothetical protein
MQGISLRPPAMTAIQGASQVLVAAPDGTAVSVWALDGAQSPGSPTSIPGLAGARAVSMAAANDGSDRVAIVAELGCAPQTIALALGSLSGGFGQVTTVVPAGSAAAVQPTVAWVPSQSYWIVSRISVGRWGPRAGAAVRLERECGRRRHRSVGGRDRGLRSVGRERHRVRAGRGGRWLRESVARVCAVGPAVAALLARVSEVTVCA